MSKTILLDLDGTLLDSNDAHASSWKEALREFDVHVAFQQVRELIGMGSDHLLPELTGIDPESTRGKNISERRGEIFRNKYLPFLKPFPQAKELIEKMLEAKLNLIVATSASKEDLKGILKQIGIEKLIKHTTSADDAEESKPSPDIILQALKKMNAKPEDAFMVGDTPYDIKAASRAGVSTIAFTCGGWGPEALRDAVAIYKDPSDLLENFESSVLHKKESKSFWNVIRG